MVKKKLNGILNKIKNNKKKVVGITALVFVFTFVVYNFSYHKKLHASVSEITNNTFKDENFYTCVIDAYNSDHQDNKKSYTDNLTDEELASITNLECGGWRYSDSDKITSAKGIEKLTGLTTLNLYGNKLTNIDLSKNTLLTNLNLYSNQLTSIDLSNNIKLTNLDLKNNALASIDISNNIELTNLDLRFNALANIDLSQNTNLTELDLQSNQLTNINLGNNTSLTILNLSFNQLTSIDLGKNIRLTNLNLGENQLLTNLNLSSNTSLISLNIDNTPLKDDILMQVGETYQIEEKIIPPKGQNFTYSIDNSSIATIEGNTITALEEGSIYFRTSFGNISFDRKLVIGLVEISLVRSEYEDDFIINDEENYVYFTRGLYSDSKIKNELKSNFGKIVRDGDTLKIVSGEKIYREYKIVCFDGGKIDDGGGYRSVVAYTNNSTNYNIVIMNCEYEFLNDGREISIKYNGKEIDRKKVVYVYLPKECKIRKDNGDLLYFGNEIFDDSNINNFINNIDNISEIDKNKINVLNGTITFEHDDGNYFNIMHGEERAAFLYPNYVNSNNYDLKNEYIYLGTNEFNNDLALFDDGHDKYDFDVILNNNIMYVMDDSDLVYYWNLIKVSSDKYDMSSDTINLGNEDIDLSKINVTNATLKVDNNKLLVMYGDEVVKEFILEGGKKTTTTTKKDDDKTTTTTKVRTTTKEEVKTTTTKKKVSIIDKIFGNKETTTKMEETTTKKNIFRKSTTTKVENSSGNVTSNNKNSFKKLVTGSNLLILLLSITGIALIIYIIVDKNKDKEA